MVNDKKTLVLYGIVIVAMLASWINGGLGGPRIATIIISAILGIGLISLLALYLYNRKNLNQTNKKEEDDDVK